MLHSFMFGIDPIFQPSRHARFSPNEEKVDGEGMENVTWSGLVVDMMRMKNSMSNKRASSVVYTTELFLVQDYS